MVLERGGDVLEIRDFSKCRELFLRDLMNEEYYLSLQKTLSWGILSLDIVESLPKVDAALEIINSCATKYGFSKLKYKEVDAVEKSSLRWYCCRGVAKEDIIYFEVGKRWVNHYFLLSLISVFIRAFVKLEYDSIENFISFLKNGGYRKVVAYNYDYQELRLLVGYNKMEEIFSHYSEIFKGYRHCRWMGRSGNTMGIRSILYSGTVFETLNRNLNKVIGTLPPLSEIN